MMRRLRRSQVAAWLQDGVAFVLVVIPLAAVDAFRVVTYRFVDWLLRKAGI